MSGKESPGSSSDSLKSTFEFLSSCSYRYTSIRLHVVCLAPITCETIFGGEWKIYIPISVIISDSYVYQNT